MRRGSLFLGIVVCFAALLFLLWPAAKDGEHGIQKAEEPGATANEGTALRRDSRQPELVQASAILRIETSGNVAAADLASALAALLERPQLDEISARLALETAWSMDAERTAQHLAKLLEVTLSDDSKGGIVRASDASPVMAASLANTAASVLRDHFERSAQATRRLERDIKDQHETVEDKRKLLASIIRAGMIIHQSERETPTDSTALASPTPPAAPEKGAAVYVDAKGDFERETQELSRLESHRQEVKEITIHHILWAGAKARE
ncbi:hypothetical protein [Haloferula sp. BvORR071]|uniref:hypothetical protein n=1 Tax=Haloferula sp. BvORR071 TaxID=1396141 RepID=UPI0005512260|nr:hypothetical protein [Haloferula sp. BvORR071]